MRSKALLVAVAAALLVFGGWKWRDGDYDREAAKWRDSLRIKDSALVQLRIDSTALANRHTTDTLTLTRWRTSWDTLVTTLVIRDTLVHRDTLRLVIGVADSTIRACERALSSCQEMAGNAEQRADMLRQANADLAALLAKPKPRSWPKVALGGGLGVAAAVAAIVLIK